MNDILPRAESTLGQPEGICSDENTVPMLNCTGCDTQIHAESSYIKQCDIA
jgi:hypothetical protein